MFHSAYFDSTNDTKKAAHHTVDLTGNLPDPKTSVRELLHCRANQASSAPTGASQRPLCVVLLLLVYRPVAQSIILTRVM